MNPISLPDEEHHLLSFKTSLLKLRDAMTEQQNQNNILRQQKHQPQQQQQQNKRGRTTEISEQLSSLLTCLHRERDCIYKVLVCATLGALLGYAVGCGWLTLGSGSYHFVPVSVTSGVTKVTYAMSAKYNVTYEQVSIDGYIKPTTRRTFVVSPWRANLAGRIRNSLLFQLVTMSYMPSSEKLGQTQIQLMMAYSPLWPLNWFLFRDFDVSQIDGRVGGGLSPMTLYPLRILLPWRRDLLDKLKRRDKVKINLRDGRYHEPSTSYLSSLISSIIATFSNGDGETGKIHAPIINPYHHPMAFHALREYVIRFDDGYVHPDLGFLIPAPSGADRGLGFVRDTFSKCQVHCFPGTADEKIKEMMEAQARLKISENQRRIDAELMEEMMKEFPAMANSSSTSIKAVDDVSAVENAGLSSPPAPTQHTQKHPVVNDRNVDPIRNTTTYEGILLAVELQQSASPFDRPYSQSEILLRIPLEAQITRKDALDTLLPMLPAGMYGLEELDDAFVLAIYLAHERGLGPVSHIWPYIATLPPRPNCALHWGWRQSIVDVVTAMSNGIGTDVHGWPAEIAKAAGMMEQIVSTLASFDAPLATRPGTSAEDITENIRWALCQVASRAIAGRETHGSLRLVPIMDLINHDVTAGKFTELTGNERLDNGSFLDADESHAGTFVVRSIRHGERKPLKRGQELMANYNIPNYSPLDWFINMGFIPPERAGKWTYIEAALPRDMRSGYGRKILKHDIPSKYFGGLFTQPTVM